MKMLLFKTIILQCPDQLWGPTSILASLPVKRPGHKFDHSLPSSAANKNKHGYISTPPYGFTVFRGNCTFIITDLVYFGRRGGMQQGIGETRIITNVIICTSI